MSYFHFLLELLENDLILEFHTQIIFLNTLLRFFLLGTNILWISVCQLDQMSLLLSIWCFCAVGIHNLLIYLYRMLPTHNRELLYIPYSLCVTAIKGTVHLRSCSNGSKLTSATTLVYKLVDLFTCDPFTGSQERFCGSDPGHDQRKTRQIWMGLCKGRGRSSTNANWSMSGSVPATFFSNFHIVRESRRLVLFRYCTDMVAVHKTLYERGLKLSSIQSRFRSTDASSTPCKQTGDLLKCRQTSIWARKKVPLVTHI